MIDELATRVQQLEAERLRPTPPAPPPRVVDLETLSALAGVLGDAEDDDAALPALTPSPHPNHN